MIQKLKGFYFNLLWLYGWVFFKLDVLYVVMEKVEKSFFCVFKEFVLVWVCFLFFKLIMRIKMVLDVVEGLKVIYEIGYIYEDIKFGNILVCLFNLMSYVF